MDDVTTVEPSSSLLSGRATRQSMTWLVVAVLLAMPIEGMAHDHRGILVTWPLRASILLGVLFGLRSRRMQPIVAGRIVLAQGVLSTVAWALLLDSSPDRIALETVAYGTILSIFTLLIAPSRQRRSWSLAVLAVMLALGAWRLLPDDPLLLWQTAVILMVHAAGVAVLDVHANRAEAIGVMAGIDSLTGLSNRRTMLARLESLPEIDGSWECPPALILLDLDHFKALNDSLGHAAGDDALVRAADALVALVRPEDLVSRWGGEEFLVLLEETDRQNAWAIAERMRDGLEDTGVTASLGIAWAHPGETVTVWIGRADEAMYEAKRAGRNRTRAHGDEAPVV